MNIPHICGKCNDYFAALPCAEAIAFIAFLKKYDILNIKRNKRRSA